MGKKNLFYLLTFLLFFFILFFSLEIMIRCLGKYKTYTEKVGKDFHTYYGESLDSPYFTWPSNHSFVESNVFFEFNYKTNSLGFRGAEFDTSNSKFRILCLGDSFTEGVGATYENSWPIQLESILSGNCSKSNIKVYNA